MRKIKLVLHNIRSIYNVGAILRTAEGFGVNEVIYSGYTPRYNDDSLLPHLREKLNRQIAKAALGAEEVVPQRVAQDVISFLDLEREKGEIIIGLENNLNDEEAKRRIMLGKKIPGRVESGRADDGLDYNLEGGSQHSSEEAGIVLVLGEEVNGIPAEVRKKMDYFLEIPMFGRKESFNVSVATGIAVAALRLGLTSGSRLP